MAIPDDFQLLFRGEVILPSDGEAYERARAVHNGAIDTRPAARKDVAWA
jgi:hypothetical protein